MKNNNTLLNALTWSENFPFCRDYIYLSFFSLEFCELLWPPTLTICWLDSSLLVYHEPFQVTRTSLEIPKVCTHPRTTLSFLFFWPLDRLPVVRYRARWSSPPAVMQKDRVALFLPLLLCGCIFLQSFPPPLYGFCIPWRGWEGFFLLSGTVPLPKTLEGWTIRSKPR